jgi:hypothetical protein
VLHSLKGLVPWDAPWSTVRAHSKSACFPLVEFGFNPGAWLWLSRIFTERGSGWRLTAGPGSPADLSAATPYLCLTRALASSLARAPWFSASMHV